MSLKKGVGILSLVVFFIFVSSSSYSEVLINEIMYNPSTSQGDDSDLEWIELVNNGTETISLKALTINGNNFGDVNITAGSFVVVARELIDGTDSDLSSFEAYYGNNDSIWNSTDGSYIAVDGDFVLGNTAPADIINLSNGTYTQLVNYTPFLSFANGNGKTLIFYKGNFTESAFVNGTPGSSNDEFAPDFNKWVNPNANNSFISGLFNITINVTDVTNVSSALINFNGTNFSMERGGDLWHFLWNTKLNSNRQYNMTIFFNDSYGASGFDKLFNITINNTNSLPQVLSANLTNTDYLNRTNGTLMALWSFVDAENDTITANETLWYINNTKVDSYANKTFILPANTTKLENWAFSVRVFDGFGWSDYANSSKITILNAKPLLDTNTTSITLSETQKANISLSASDLDNDFLNYTINDSRFLKENNYFIWNTGLSDSGIYYVNLTANDSIDINSIIINITINDARDLDNDGNPDFNESDDDNDNIPDENDFLTGNLSHIKANLPISLAINGTSNFSKLFNGTYMINITNGSLTIIEFNFTFNSSSRLDFGNLTINKTTNGSSAVSIKGSLNLFGFTKIIFLEKINERVKSVCIKDADASFDSISLACDSENESLLICDNSTSGKYACHDTGSFYKITGLSHSAVKEQCRDNDGDSYGTGCSAGEDCNDNDASKTTDCSTSSGSSGSPGNSGSGGGGGVVCISNWQCKEWTECINGFRNRDCLDTSQCAFPTKKPEIAQECVIGIETKIASTRKQTEMKNATIEKTKVATKKNIPSISGEVIATIEGKNTSLGIFIAFLEVLVVVGAYLGIKMRFS